MDTDAGASDAKGGVQQREYAIEETGQPTLAIVETVAAYVGREVEDLEPLEHTVNVDALVELLAHDRGDFSRSPGERPPGTEVSFVYEDCLVTATRDRITVRAV